MQRGDHDRDRHLEGRMMYTKDFLLSLKYRKYKPPESVVRFNELYVYAPKPQVNRPRVDRPVTKGTRAEFAQKIVSDSERLELKQKRKEEEKEKLRQKFFPKQPSTAAAGAPKRPPLPSKPQKIPSPETEEKSPDPLTEILTAAQEQQISLTGRIESDTEPANRPGARSVLPPRRTPGAVETDDHRMEQRRKQIGYGYVTRGYKNYVILIPKDKRSGSDPQTPNTLQKCSKRSWDGQLALWRRKLHQYDPQGEAEVPDSEVSAAEGEEGGKLVTPSKASAHVSAQEREVLAQMRRDAKLKEQQKKDAAVDIGVQCPDPKTVTPEPTDMKQIGESRPAQ